MRARPMLAPPHASCAIQGDSGCEGCIRVSGVFCSVVQPNQKTVLPAREKEVPGIRTRRCREHGGSTSAVCATVPPANVFYMAGKSRSVAPVLPTRLAVHGESLGQPCVLFSEEGFPCTSVGHLSELY